MSISIPADHPTAAGHFPGKPIVPGALLLARIVHAVTCDRPVTIRAAKFLHPVRPGETVTLAWHKASGGDIRFECSLEHSDEKVLSGSLSFADLPC